MRSVTLSLLLWSLVSATAFSQAPPPPPPPPGPLPPPPVPLGNPITPAKINLGKTLFWDEQLSADRTVACGTCHIPTRGGSDPRSILDSSFATHPGFDTLFGTPDDVTGSPGVVKNSASGALVKEAPFDLVPQVTPRKAPSMINAAYAPRLFWDGRADNVFTDPLTGAVVLQNLAALESQSVGPPVSDVEMGSVSRTWTDVANRITSVTPLALAPVIPPALSLWINGRPYAALFTEAFGSAGITPSRIAMAIATYERSLVSNQSPFDNFLAGVPNALTPQQLAGFNLFTTPGTCVPCHGGPLQTDQAFHNNGVRPIFEDLGRGAITGNPGDNGRFKTPNLRNVALRGPYFHNGEMATLLDVVNFYDRGGDFHLNQDPVIHPLNLNPTQKANLVAFLSALTDPRVAAGVAPFDRPLLYSESAKVPQSYGLGSPGSGGFTPRFVALEPPMLGNPGFTFGIADALGGAPTILALDVAASPPDTVVAGLPFHLAGSFAFTVLPIGSMLGTGAGGGFTSLTWALPNTPTLAGFELFLQAFIVDTDGKNGFATTPGLEIRLFASN